MNTNCKICNRYGHCQRYKSVGDWLCPKHYRQMFLYGKIIETRFDKNKIEEKDDYAEIILVSQTMGEDTKEIARAKIDKADIDKVKPYKWHLKDNTYFSKKTNITMHKFYVIGKINCKNVRLNRFLFDLNDDEDDVIDHINQDSLDNRRCNLRRCMQHKNMINQKKRIDNISGTTGVWYRKDRNKWIAEIKVNEKKIVLGEFDTKEEAIRARKEAEKKYFGEFAPKEIKNEPQPIS